ncbi:MAG: class II aldolase [Clostridia bacterium]|nr:class II aldolase [Clostridia bacterium]
MQNSIKDLIEISTYAGNRVDYTQGGGGNTSVKVDDTVMLIKASGFRLIDINDTTGFVAVDGNKIRNYYSNVDLSVEKDYEKESGELNKNSVIELDGIKTLRPSVEVGFHAILKKYVIHTHSIYANLITCAVKGEEIASKIFNGKLDYVFLPYINPGFSLTLKMADTIKEYLSKTGRYPQVIFMKNHGLVVTSDCVKEVKELNDKVNNLIKEYFNLKNSYISINLAENNGAYISSTPLVKEYLEKYGDFTEILEKYPLYPDQLVYLNNIINFNKEKLVVKDNSVVYNTELKEATTLEETLFAYLFVIKTLTEKGLEISVMNEKEVAFINGWEAEKYRRSVK